MLKEHIQLLIRREARVVLGHRLFNLWLLALVLLATLLSIAFSNGSLIYLREKMEDPFTNWVNISYANNHMNAVAGYEAMKEDARDPELMQHYLYTDVQVDHVDSYSLLSCDGDTSHFVSFRFFEAMNTSLMSAILTEDNIVGGKGLPADSINPLSMGLIVTQSLMDRLGWHTADSLPPYVSMFCHVGDEADTTGIKVLQGHFAACPVPLLAVVRRLPMNMEVIASRFFEAQQRNPPLNTMLLGHHPEYITGLLYYVKQGVENDFTARVKAAVPDSLKATLQFSPADDDLQQRYRCWQKGSVWCVSVGSFNTPRSVFTAIDRQICQAANPQDILRIYEYKTDDEKVVDESSFITLSFAKLDSIRAFEQYVKQHYKVQIEMEQVNSKENFAAVSRIALILSAAMIVFAIICIVFFIVNMLQSYFQKVKHNLGTFKAFGMSNGELMRAYTIILIAIIFTALVMALAAAVVIQYALPLKDGQYYHLYLWSYETLAAITIIVCATIATALMVMRRLLTHTPGDLIYDR